MSLYNWRINVFIKHDLISPNLTYVALDVGHLHPVASVKTVLLLVSFASRLLKLHHFVAQSSGRSTPESDTNVVVGAKGACLVSITMFCELFYEV